MSDYTEVFCPCSGSRSFTRVDGCKCLGVTCAVSPSWQRLENVTDSLVWNMRKCFIVRSKASPGECNKSGATGRCGWLRAPWWRGKTFRDPGSEPVTRSGSRGPESPCPAGPRGRSGKGWRSCQGPDSAATSHGWWGRQRRGGWSPREGNGKYVF